MYERIFWIKYIFRLLHMFTVITLAGHVIYQYLFPCNQKDDQVFLGIFSAIMIVSGFTNLYILDPKTKMREFAPKWIGTLHIKTLSSIIIMTPIITYITADPIPIQFYFVVFWIIVSPFLRFYREGCSEIVRQMESLS